jgi:hypothetical protein
MSASDLLDPPLPPPAPDADADEPAGPTGRTLIDLGSVEAPTCTDGACL